MIYGLAGTGKSFLLQVIAKENTADNTHVCAPTGKAAQRLRAKGGVAAGTIHSLFYRLIQKGHR